MLQRKTQLGDRNVINSMKRIILAKVRARLKLIDCIAYFCVLLRLRNLIPTSAKLHIVKFAIIPHLTYCQTVWHFCRASDTRKLERIQGSALRSVYCDNVSSYEELLRRVSLPTLYTRRLQDIAIMMFLKSKTVWRPRISRTYSLSLVFIII